MYNLENSALLNHNSPILPNSSFVNIPASNIRPPSNISNAFDRYGCGGINQSGGFKYNNRPRKNKRRTKRRSKIGGYDMFPRTGEEEVETAAEEAGSHHGTGTNYLLDEDEQGEEGEEGDEEAAARIEAAARVNNIIGDPLDTAAKYIKDINQTSNKSVLINKIKQFYHQISIINTRLYEISPQDILQKQEKLKDMVENLKTMVEKFIQKFPMVIVIEKFFNRVDINKFLKNIKEFNNISDYDPVNLVRFFLNRFLEKVEEKKYTDTLEQVFNEAANEIHKKAVEDAGVGKEVVKRWWRRGGRKSRKSRKSKKSRKSRKSRKNII